MATDPDRLSITIGDIREAIETFRPDSAWKELSMAGKIRSMVRDFMELANAGGGIPNATIGGLPSRQASRQASDNAENLDLLAGFLNYLIENLDHDGYSLAEISQILGRPDDKGLVALVQRLQESKRGRPGAKSK
jgi:hypothetical protein